MTITPDHDRLHHAVDRLNRTQVQALYVVVESMLGEPVTTVLTGERRGPHRLSFTAAGAGPEDLAERAEDYLRATGYGDPIA